MDDRIFVVDSSGGPHNLLYAGLSSDSHEGHRMRVGRSGRFRPLESSQVRLSVEWQYPAKKDTAAASAGHSVRGH